MSSRFSIIFSAWLARLACRHPITVLVIGVLIAILSIALTIDRLRFQPDRNDLLSKDLEWNQRILDWWESFPNMSDMVVAVDTASGPGNPSEQRTRAEEFVGDLAAHLERNDSIAKVDWGAPSRGFSPKAARLQSLKQFRAALIQAESAAPLLQSNSPSEALASISQSIAASSHESTESSVQEDLVTRIDSLATFINAISDSLDPDARPDNPFTEISQGNTPDWRYLESPNGRFLFLRLTPKNGTDVLDATAAPIAAVRAAIEHTKAAHPGIDVGFTGIDVVESDETEVATVDSAVSSILAALLIAALLITAFHGWRKPLQAMLALIIGIAWTFGFLTLAIGHLQILSVVFVVILLGLGIDFAIHLSTTIEEFRHEHPDGKDPFQKVLAEAFRVTGPGVLTGAATTAAAFAATTFTDFKGVAELGIIACAGIVLCMITMFTLYPAMLALFHHSHRHIRPLTERTIHIFEPRWLMPITRHPRTVTLLATLLVIAGAVIGSRVTFSEDLLALQPRGVDSVEWQKRIADEGNLSIWYAVSICNSLDHAHARQTLFTNLPTVSHVGGIGLLFNGNEPEKLELARNTAARLNLDQPFSPIAHANPESLATQLQAMRSLLATSTQATTLPIPLTQALQSLSDAINRATTRLANLNPQSQRPALDQLAANYAQFRIDLYTKLQALTDPTPIQAADLPPAAIDAFIDRTNPDTPRYALEVYPKLPDNSNITSPLDPQFLDTFMRDVQSIDQRVTGVLPQIYFSNEVIRTSFVRSGVIAIIVVVVIVLIVFRSFTDAAMCLMPVIVGFILTFAVMVALGMSVNPANIIVLPLLFGIGVDSGVHIVHRFRLNPRERPLGLTHGTGKGVTLTSLTTMVGFGAMLVARHRGIQGLGFVLSIGIGFTLLTCWTLLPAVLEMRRRARAENAAARRSARNAAHAA